MCNPEDQLNPAVANQKNFLEETGAFMENLQMGFWNISILWLLLHLTQTCCLLFRAATDGWAESEEEVQL